MKKHITITIILTIVFLFSSCTKMPTIHVDSDDSPLMIYLWDKNEFLKHHIDVYNSGFDEPQIEYQSFDDSYLKNMYYTIHKEIKTEKGPDLIYIGQNYHRYTKLEDNIDLYVDMDDMIERSAVFDMSNYNQSIMDKAIVDDKRAYILVSYDASIIICVNEVLEQYYFGALNDLDYETYIDILVNHQQEHDSTVIGAPISSSMILEQIIKNKTIEPSVLLEKALEVEKKQISSFNKRDYEAMNRDYEAMTNNFVKWYLDKELLFVRLIGNLVYRDKLESNTSIFGDLYYNYNLLNQQGKQMQVLNLPILTNKNVVESGFAININSNRKNKAMRFIEYMLSLDVQAGEKYPPRVPVNKQALDKLVAQYTAENSDLFTSLEREVPLPNHIVHDALEVIKRQSVPLEQKTDTAYSECVKQHKDLFFKGEMDFHSFIDFANNKLDDFYREEENGDN